jgi:oxygen-dependent protoporphyrinogen oxidase
VDLIRPHAADAAAALEAIAYAPVATVASAYRVADIVHPLDGFGCLLPGLEKRRVLGVLFSSSMFEGRAPQGHVLLTTFIGGRRHPELPGMQEEQIAALAHAEHGALLGTRGRSGLAGGDALAARHSAVHAGPLEPRGARPGH